MEIIINESEAQPDINLVIDAPIRNYWRIGPPVSLIEPQQVVISQADLKKARNSNYNYLEILVEGVLTPNEVKLTHEFKKRKPSLFEEERIVMDKRVLDGPAYTHIEQSVRQSEPKATIFRFKYPIEKLLEIQSNSDWIYTLCRDTEGGNIFLLLYFVLPSFGGTVASGVKIPRGRVQ